MKPGEIMRTVTSRAGVVRVRNALNPLLWLCVVASPVCFACAYALYADPILRYTLAGVGILPIVSSLIAYVYFMLKDPTRLQSEEYLLRQHELSIIERKSGLPISLNDDPVEGATLSIERKKRFSQEDQP